MTMPHLMNCQHSDSWCLDCVKKLYDENEKEIEHLNNVIRSLHKEIRDQREEITELKRINKLLTGHEEPPEINSRAWIV